MSKVEELCNLCRCGKKGYENGEKKKYSGLMNTWHSVKYKRWLGTKIIEGKKEHLYKEDTKYIFAYKQPIYYYFDELTWELKQKYPTLRSQKKYLRDNQRYTYPLFSYGCVFMVCNIINRGEQFFIRWDSGDDEIGHTFLIPNNKRVRVMDFIQENFKKLDFDTLLIDYIEENNFSLC